MNRTKQREYIKSLEDLCSSEGIFPIINGTFYTFTSPTNTAIHLLFAWNDKLYNLSLDSTPREVTGDLSGKLTRISAVEFYGKIANILVSKGIIPGARVSYPRARTMSQIIPKYKNDKEVVYVKGGGLFLNGVRIWDISLGLVTVFELVDRVPFIGIAKETSTPEIISTTPKVGDILVTLNPNANFSTFTQHMVDYWPYLKQGIESKHTGEGPALLILQDEASKRAFLQLINNTNVTHG